jgi:hypothetical protein
MMNRTGRLIKLRFLRWRKRVTCDVDMCGLSGRNGQKNSTCDMEEAFVIGGDGAQARLHSMGIKIHCVHRTWGIMTKKPCTDGKLRSHYASGRVGKRSNDHATPPQRDSPVTTKVGLPARYWSENSLWIEQIRGFALLKLPGEPTAKAPPIAHQLTNWSPIGVDSNSEKKKRKKFH